MRPAADQDAERRNAETPDVQEGDDDNDKNVRAADHDDLHAAAPRFAYAAGDDNYDAADDHHRTASEGERSAGRHDDDQNNDNDHNHDDDRTERNGTEDEGEAAGQREAEGPVGPG